MRKGGQCGSKAKPRLRDLGPGDEEAEASLRLWSYDLTTLYKCIIIIIVIIIIIIIIIIVVVVVVVVDISSGVSRKVVRKTFLSSHKDESS